MGYAGFTQSSNPNRYVVISKLMIYKEITHAIFLFVAQNPSRYPSFSR